MSRGVFLRFVFALPPAMPLRGPGLLLFAVLGCVLSLTQSLTFVSMARAPSLTRLALYVCQSLIISGRTADISERLSGTDMVLLTGTRIRQNSQRGNSNQYETAWRDVMNMGWGPGPHTNRSCGAQILINKGFSPNDAVRSNVFTPPANLSGRGAVVTLFVMYLPPRPTREYEAPAYTIGIVLLLQWVCAELAQTPARSTIIGGGDVNDGFGIMRDEAHRDELGDQIVGQRNAKQEHFAATEFLKVFCRFNLAAINTVIGDGGDTCTGPTGAMTRPDYVFALVGLLRAVKDCKVLRRKERTLQMDESKKDLDHLPIAMTF